MLLLKALRLLGRVKSLGGPSKDGEEGGRRIGDVCATGDAFGPLSGFEFARRHACFKADTANGCHFAVGDLNTVGGAIGGAQAFDFARHQYRMIFRVGCGAALHVVGESGDFVRHPFGVAQGRGIDHEGRHVVDDRTVSTVFGLNRSAPREDASHEFAGPAKARSFVLRKGHERPRRLLPHVLRFRGRVSFGRENDGLVEGLPCEHCHAGFTHGDDGGGEIKHERTASVDVGERAAERIRTEACFGAAIRRNKRTELVDVDEMDRYHARGGGLFAVRADAPEVATVGDRVHAQTVLAGAFDRHFGRFVARSLTVAEIPFELQDGSGVFDDSGRRIGTEPTCLQVVGVHGDHADAVTVVTAQVGKHHMVGDDPGFGFVASRGGEEVLRDGTQELFRIAHGDSLKN